MAPTQRCPSCNTVMYADKEKYYPAGTEVVYLCRNDTCRTYVNSGKRYREQIKKFIDKR